ncbi:hypothetical protein TRIATDRAFT_299239 [Trichoderma atroviride IMI 206040]|uniref:Uncharacterized protein n=1 Tax=Hypocrea atroviridis (strain ATCC 20476 / IMI 206040) TaxID=452589 RepID=G9NRT8_HYPAI|nr:uncharacterized protein TRIATDRAFT_299239 [Trichoderma atroviride IMI 206040]EHK46720.1 hypothetical protein TRIATDRAFT_299239 [Trichoderma atroviride IMI 206040]
MTGHLQKRNACHVLLTVMESHQPPVLGTITTSPCQFDKRRASEAAQLIQTGIPQKQQAQKTAEIHQARR